MHAPTRVRAAGLGAILAAAISLSLPVPAAHAYSQAGERWPGTTITYANEAPAYGSAVRYAVRIWNRARVGVRFVKAPAANARVVFRYARRARGFGPTGCEGISGGTTQAGPGPSSERCGYRSSGTAAARPSAGSRPRTSWATCWDWGTRIAAAR